MIEADREFLVGDWVVARRNDRLLANDKGWVKNGSDGIVVATDADRSRVTVAFDPGVAARTERQYPSDTRRPQAPDPNVEDRTGPPRHSLLPVSAQVTIEATVGADGVLVVPADELGKVGARPGDRVRVEPVQHRRVRSMLGAGAHQPGAPGGFADDDLQAVRREMGTGLGDDLTA